MTRALKEFIESHASLLDTHDWEKLFIEAYDENLLTSEVRELHEMLLTADIVDSTNIRTKLLLEYIHAALDNAKSKYVDLSFENLRVVDSYAVQFLRCYLNNTFGFHESEALELMYYNQKTLGILLTDTSKNSGQRGINNYVITYIR